MSSSARLGRTNGRSARGRRVDPAVQHLQDEWADIALTVLKRRAVERQSSPHTRSDRPTQSPRNGHRKSEAAS